MKSSVNGVSAAEAYPKQYLYRRIVRAKLFIDENFHDRIDLENIADKACYSKFHFVRVFSEIYGCTPHRYLSGIRVEKAAQMLRCGVEVKAACYAVGFESVGSFTTLFKRRFGVSPARFRAEHRRRTEGLANTPLAYVPGCFAGKSGWSRKAILEK